MGLLSPEVQLPMRYNLAPTQSAPVIIRGDDAGGAVLRTMRWGLVPSWAKEEAIGNSLINARAETIDTRPAFRNAFKKRRCIVPISGFYEWQAIEGQKAKQPIYMTPTGVDPWLLAGLWESWASPAGQLIDSYTIITTSANEMVSKVHDRMPVILGPAEARQWIGTDPSKANPSADQLRALLDPYPADLMLSQLVSRAVNSPKRDGPECIQRADLQGFGGLFGPQS